ncbi:TIGR03943 family protein [Planomonospora sp. ID82291]|uniref:TIGR03943 family putative permease subunit n=1 Tax=Planomonospora sp. ID82291 TaxID=2738136 RepID=UPI0018C36096|nr:TIGR03943 family protein [Planomonospora sp. ID82291]MBG0816432.1 TIGR03943 family protein [Planomonospora sp. ID82291]
MNRTGQNLVLLLLGGALVKISAFSADFANYVKPGFRPLLIAAGAVLVLLSVAALALDRHRGTGTARRADLRRARAAEEEDARAAEERHLALLVGREPAASPQTRAPEPEPEPEHGHGHEHGHEHRGGSRVAWLLTVPIAVAFLAAPPALGSFAVRQAEQTPQAPPPVIVEADPVTLENGRVNDLSMIEFANLDWDDPGGSLRGKTVRLTGFVVPSGRRDAWHLTRMRIGCCAADALAMQVVVRGVPAPETDSWVRVTGTWIPRKNHTTDAYTPPELAASRVERTAPPDEPYE